MVSCLVSKSGIIVDVGLKGDETKYRGFYFEDERDYQHLSVRNFLCLALRVQKLLCSYVGKAENMGIPTWVML